MAQSLELIVFPSFELLGFESLDGGAPGGGVHLHLFDFDLVRHHRVLRDLHGPGVSGQTISSAGLVFGDFCEVVSEDAQAAVAVLKHQQGLDGWDHAGC
ncbi:MAG: hypothetical protein EAZ84_13440 [Verrucomicrobia bacterium]|nr:MAG: hypothetical protein EAZ84_13440 [Verrucomicrobiota bacterium]